MAAWLVFIRAKNLELTINAADIDADTLEVLFEMKSKLTHYKDEQDEAERKLKELAGKK